MLPEEIAKSIARVESTCALLENDMSLFHPLAAYLLPKKRQMDINELPRDGRKIKLNRIDWNRQYNAGINRCVGFDIIWI